MSSISNAWIEHQLEQARCRFCGSRPDECGGTCVSETSEQVIEVDIKVDGRSTIDFIRIPQIGDKHPDFAAAVKPRKVSPKAFCQWPEWKALAARLGVPAGLTNVVLDVSMDCGVRLTVTTLGMDHQCPQPPSGTRHTAPGSEEQSSDSPPLSEDTTATGPS